jgi:hypothetical protein
MFFRLQLPIKGEGGEGVQILFIAINISLSTQSLWGSHKRTAQNSTQNEDMALKHSSTQKLGAVGAVEVEEKEAAAAEEEEATEKAKEAERAGEGEEEEKSRSRGQSWTILPTDPFPLFPSSLSPSPEILAAMICAQRDRPEGEVDSLSHLSPLLPAFNLPLNPSASLPPYLTLSLASHSGNGGGTRG